jgi:hypothetical protein
MRMLIIGKIIAYKGINPLFLLFFTINKLIKKLFKN